jgi:hypothetical protein
MCCWAISSSCSGCIVSSFVVFATSKVRIRRGPPHRAPSLDPAGGDLISAFRSRLHLSRASRGDVVRAAHVGLYVRWIAGVGHIAGAAYEVESDSVA